MRDRSESKMADRDQVRTFVETSAFCVTKCQVYLACDSFEQLPGTETAYKAATSDLSINVYWNTGL